MKAKKKLFLTVLTLVLLVGLVATGTALAAPAGISVHQPTRVVGTIEFVNWVKGDPNDISVDQTTNEFVNPVEVLTYRFHGNLEGTYIESIVVRAPVSPLALTGKGPYTLEGRATFVGTLNGKKVSWGADVAGAGYLDPAYAFRGWETGVNTIAGSTGPLSHLRGIIICQGIFDGQDPTYGGNTYSGWLTGETGKR